MKANLPEKNFFDSFYIWFNKEKREEYYSTPLYLYSVNRKDDFENRLLTLYFDKKEVKGRTKEGKLKKYTIICGIVFVVLAVVLSILFVMK